MDWVPLFGEFHAEGNIIRYHGKLLDSIDKEGKTKQVATTGAFITNDTFIEGSIKCKIQFESDAKDNCAQIMFNRDTKRNEFAVAGIGPGPAPFCIQILKQGSWETPSGYIGDRSFIKPNTDYSLELVVKGSNVILEINNVPIAEADIPDIKGSVGMWCTSSSNIIITDYTIESKQAKAFVIIEYKNPYFEIYREVIEHVCSIFNIEAKLAYNTNGPGIIIADIIKDIRESKFIIADITPDNANVFYEVGYSHALNKPTILICDESRKQLPFDISPFRTIFYTNSISGKSKLESNLQKHINSIINGAE